MKSFAQKSLVAVAAMIGSSAVMNAAPLISIGDSVDVFFNGSTNAQWRSNLFYTDGIDNLQSAVIANSPAGTVAFPTLAANGGAAVIARPKVDAWVFYVSPGVEVNVGRNSNASLTLYFREDFLFYTRYSDELNTELANLFIDGSYDFGNLTTSAGFSFVQTQQNSPQTNGTNFVANLVETNQLNAYADANYDISPKAWASAGFSWSQTDYTNNDEFQDRYSNNNIYSAPVSFFWRITPKLSVGPSFRFRYTDPSANGGFTGIVGTTPIGPTPRVTPSDYYDYFFNIAVQGEVLPKLNVGLNVGYQFRDPGRDRVTTTAGISRTSSQSQRHQFTIVADAEYEITPKLMSYVNFYHDFGVGAEGQTVVNLGGDTGVLYQFNNYISSNLEFGMENSDYQDTQGRNDLTTTSSFSVNYNPNLYWQFSVGYFYMNNNSTGNVTAANLSGNTGASFQAHTINMQATFRY
ncbi:hypothetical protein [Cerasicoccus arenae]|uniref:Uncharacterized protein n=1 Tax=Cerasicoccus arenae TaxID=424488 RepID=A0A8J3DGW0_9BACT|nr:hypothetical protein [Cerasicoccus arenae]MBK1857985.1 hypothetical protein [Cerasicoccus arenae]GHB97653.1 hypothetical protein GCM10007047_11880 [Cerasicoccus arenae]